MFSEILNNKYYKLMVLLATEFPGSEDINEAKHLLKNIDVIHLYKCTSEHEMDTVIYPNLIRLFNGNLPEIWHNNYNETRKRLSFMIDKLKEVSNNLHNAGIPIVALKNGGIAVAMIDDIAKCPMGDIDTLVNKKDFIKAHNILLEMGFKFMFRSEFEFEDLQMAFKDGGSEYLFKDSNGNEMWFEMSWRPMAGRWIRPDKEPKAEDLINNSVYASSSKVKVLSPEDNLLQVAVHTAKHSYVREPGFRLHLDVDRIVKYNMIDWELFLKKVNEVGVNTAVYFSLFIPSVVFSTPIPKPVLNALKPNSLKNYLIKFYLKKAKLLHPIEDKFSKFDFIIFHILLYDKFTDAIKVIFPSIKWLKIKYNFSNNMYVPYFLIVRVLDLVGVRKIYK
jgi:hypothetical protein